MLFKASVPGSAMLLGEHAVLHHHPAIVCAINRRLTVLLKPRQDKKIFIHSNIVGEYATDIYSIAPKKPFHFILTVIKYYQNVLVSGFDLIIESDVNDKMGLGSSAAVTVGTVSVIDQWVGEKRDGRMDEWYRVAVSVVREVQGAGSGADVAASVFGGVVYYRQDPVEIKSLAINIPINLVYSGYKMATVDVIRKVNELAANQPDRVKNIYKYLGECVDLGWMAIQKHDWPELGKIFYQHQEGQEQLGVSDRTLDAIINQVKALSSVYGAKISGAGLGDCVVILGDLPDNYFPLNNQQREQGIKKIPVSVEANGIIF